MLVVSKLSLSCCKTSSPLKANLLVSALSTHYDTSSLRCPVDHHAPRHRSWQFQRPHQPVPCLSRPQPPQLHFSCIHPNRPPAHHLLCRCPRLLCLPSGSGPHPFSPPPGFYPCQCFLLLLHHPFLPYYGIILTGNICNNEIPSLTCYTPVTFPLSPVSSLLFSLQPNPTRPFSPLIHRHGSCQRGPQLKQHSSTHSANYVLLLEMLYWRGVALEIAMAAPSESPLLALLLQQRSKHCRAQGSGLSTLLCPPTHGPIRAKV